MSELKVKQENVVVAYNNATKEAKQVLLDIFGSDVLEPFKYEDLDDNEKKVLAAYSRLRRKAKEKFPDWKPDWTNNNQAKWRVWFEYKAGVGFVVGDSFCGRAGAYALCGSRLCFPSSKEAIEFATENIEDYNIILTQ